MNAAYKVTALICSVLGLLVGLGIIYCGDIAGGAIVILLSVIVFELEDIADLRRLVR
jgi:hypothetical protein